MKLYKHQKKQNKAVRKELKKHNHVLFGASVGFGKSICMSDFISEALAQDKRVLVLAPFRKLIFQLEQTFAMNKPHVIMGTINRGDRYSGLVLSSLDTMNSQLKRSNQYFDGFDLIIIDEVHISGNFPPAPNSRMAILYNKFWDKAKWIGFSGTPIKANGYRLEGWDKTIYKYQTGKLIEMGFLANYKYYAPKEIDLSSLKVSSNGEYMASDMEEVTATPSAIKSVKKIWKQKAKGKKVLIFASTIHHAELLKKSIKGSNVIHSKLKESDISRVLQEFEMSASGTLINVDMLTTGFDDPTVDFLILARPIKSIRVFIQACGRALRLYGDKVTDIYDMCSCYKTCGMPDELRDFDAVKKPVEQTDGDGESLIVAMKCPHCKTVSPSNEYRIERRTTKKMLISSFFCPACEELADERRKDLKQVDEMVEVKKLEVKTLNFRERKDYVSRLVVEFTNANVKWSHFIVTAINVSGRSELLDQEIAKDVTTKTKWKNIMKIYDSCK